MQKYYEDWKVSPEGVARLSHMVLDSEGILSGNGHRAGVYEILFANPKTGDEVSAYIGQAGKTPEAPNYVASDIYERVLQHLKRWLGGKYLTYWTGLEEKSDWKIKIRVLAEEESYEKRLELESRFIEEKHPFLQDTKGGKYTLYPSPEYKRNDLCISPWGGQRRAAFLEKEKECRSA